MQRKNSEAIGVYRGNPRFFTTEARP